MSAGAAIAVLLSLPLLTSLVLTGWERVWGGESANPLPGWAHALLMAAQAAVVAGLFLAASRPSLYAAGALYAALGAGAWWMRYRHGNVSCGCWGASSSTISWRLIAADFSLAGAAVAAGILTRPELALAEATALLLGSVAAVTLFALLIPEFRHAHEGARARADRYRDWVHGFPDLEVK